MIGIIGAPHRVEVAERSAVSAIIVLETPRPTPRRTRLPTPRPTSQPSPRPHIETPAAVAQRAAPHAHRPRGGARAAHRLPPAPRVPAMPASRTGGIGIAAAPGAGFGEAGRADGAGPGFGDGSGNGTGGDSNAAATADVPCGAVDFLPVEAPTYRNGTAYERIKATVQLRDGHPQTALFPYSWMYPNGEQTDPWSNTNLRLHPNAPVPAQLPPPGADIASYPELIRYILAHTKAGGITDLGECPPLRH